MTYKFEDYVRFRLEQASETLDEASVLLDRNFLGGAYNRIYYGCFYAVSALLYTKNLAVSKHSAVKSLFHQHFMKEKVFPPEMGAFYSNLLERRLQGDYKEFMEFERSEVEAALQEAHEFVAEVSNVTRKRLEELKSQ